MHPHRTSHERPLSIVRGRDLAEEIELLQQEAVRRDEGYCARNLTASAELRRVLFAMRGGSRLRADRVHGVSIRVIAGHLELHVGDAWDMLPYPIRHTEGACSFWALYEHTIDLPVGTWLSIDPRLPHDVEALDDCAFIMDVRPHVA